MTDVRDQINSNPPANGNRGEKRLPKPLLIIALIAIFFSVTSLMVSRDMLVRYQAQVTLQMAADRAAIAGALYLPASPARALRAAEQSAKLSGLRRSNMVYAEVAPDGTSFRVGLKCAAPVVILGLLHSGAEVTALSMMEVRRVPQPASSTGFFPATFNASALGKAHPRALTAAPAVAYAAPTMTLQ